MHTNKKSGMEKWHESFDYCEQNTSLGTTPNPESCSWERFLKAALKYSLVILAYSVIVGAICHRALDENELDVIVRKRIPDVFWWGDENCSQKSRRLVE